MIIINAAVRLLAVKDVKDLSLPTLRRVAQDPSDPRSGKAKSILQRKYGIGKKTGMTRDQGKNLTKYTKDTIKNDKAASKRSSARDKWKKAQDAYHQAMEKYKTSKTPAGKERLVKLRMKLNEAKQNYQALKTEHAQTTKQMNRSKKTFKESMRPKNITERRSAKQRAADKKASDDAFNKYLADRMVNRRVK